MWLFYQWEPRGGLDPFTAVNLVIFIFILWLDRKQIGIGTILNMVLVGFEIQWFTTIYHQLFGYRTTFLIVAADTLIGLILFTLGASLYMAPDLGAVPYDAIAPIITQRTKLSYRTARITQDVLFMVAAVMLLSHIDKRTYHTIYNALQTTETMRNNMSEYSTSDLMKNARKSPYFNAGMDRAKLT